MYKVDIIIILSNVASSRCAMIQILFNFH